MAPRRALTDSPFDTLEKAFDLLATGPRPLSLDGSQRSPACPAGRSLSAS